MIDYNPLSPPPLVAISPLFFLSIYGAIYKCDTLTIDWSLRGIVLRWHMILWRKFMLRNMFPMMYFWTMVSWLDRVTFGGCGIENFHKVPWKRFASQIVIKIIRFGGSYYNETEREGVKCTNQFIPIDSTAQSSSSFSSTLQFHDVIVIEDLIIQIETNVVD